MKSIIVNDIFPFDHTDSVIYLVKFVSIKTVGEGVRRTRVCFIGLITLLGTRGTTSSVEMLASNDIDLFTSSV